MSIFVKAFRILSFIKCRKGGVLTVNLLEFCRKKNCPNFPCSCICASVDKIFPISNKILARFAAFIQMYLPVRRWLEIWVWELSLGVLSLCDSHPPSARGGCVVIILSLSPSVVVIFTSTCADFSPLYQKSLSSTIYMQKQINFAPTKRYLYSCSFEYKKKLTQK